MKTIYIKIITMSFIYMFIHLTTKAQDKLKGNSFIGINIGQSWLGGNVAKNNYNDPTSGFARNPGISFGLDGAYYLSRFIGIGGLFSYSEYGMHSDQLAAGTDYAYGTDFGSAQTGVYKSTNFLVGPYFSYPATKWLTFDYRLLGGVSHTINPAILYTLEDAGKFYYYSQNKVSASAFGFQTGIGLRAHIFRGITITLRGDYFYSNPDFNIAYTGIQNVSPALRYINNYHQPFAGINANLGVAYSFGK
jgi:hypothetical protein